MSDHFLRVLHYISEKLKGDGEERERRYRELPEVERILEDIRRELPGARVAAEHRIGALSVGDVAVACAASAPHRGEAFRACRLLIDRIKARLPIWKREHYLDGTREWVNAASTSTQEAPSRD